MCVRMCVNLISDVSFTAWLSFSVSAPFSLHHPEN